MNEREKLPMGSAASVEADYRFGRQLLSFMERRNKLIVTILISILVCSGILYSLHLGDRLRFEDERQYHTLAKNIVEHHRYTYNGTSPTAYRPPGYPAILSLFVFLGASPVHLRIVNFIALGLSLYLLNKILTAQSSPLAGTLGPLLVVCYPVLFYTAGTLYPQTIGALLLIVIVLLLTRKERPYWAFIAGGLLFGCLVLTIPIFLLILPVFAIWLYFWQESMKVTRVLTVIAVACVPIGMWSARNYATFDEFLLISSNSGRNLLLGNCENTTPKTGVVDTSRYDAEADRLNLNEVARDRYCRSKAIEFVLDHKIRATKLYVQKTLNYFNYTNRISTKGETSVAKDILMLVTYGPLALMLFLRVLLLGRFKPSRFEALLIILYFSSALFHAIFFTRIRFRLPFDYLLISLVAIFLTEVVLTRDAGHNTHQGHGRRDEETTTPPA